MACRIGTSGFQYPEWKGAFYPSDLPVAKMLPYYAERFPTTEVNYTFRSFPSLKTLNRWSDQTPEHFVFSLKAPQRITHFAKLKNCGEVARSFFEVVKPLGSKLGPVLFQLPPNFSKDVVLLRDFLEELPESVRAAFEFRHESWFAEPVWEVLHAANAALCIAESAELATPIKATADFGYLRLRREDYTKRDLRRWAEEIAAQQKEWRQTFIYLKHEEEGVGPKFANTLREELFRLTGG